MFERYSEPARRAIFFARHEASQCGAGYIEPEHLLLGLLRESTLVRNLMSGSSLDQIRSRVEAPTAKRVRVSISVDMPLSPACKRVLAYSHEEAERLNHSQIGPGHLALALMREADTFAARLLSEHGAILQSLREQLAGSPAHSDKISNENVIRTLRASFDPVTYRLNPEIEPATVFFLR